MNSPKEAKYSFVLRLNEKPSKYKLTIKQVVKTEDNEEELEIKAIIKTAMKPYNDKQVCYDLSLFPPVINGKGVRKYEKWDWIFARLYLINDGLRVIVGQHGDLQGIVGKEAILKKWEKVKHDIRELYVIENIDPLLDHMDNAMALNFAGLYQSDILINLLFNDIFYSYDGAEKVTAKIIGKHFGDIPIFVNQMKRLEYVDPENQTARINFHADWITDKLDIEGVNHYLASVAPSSIEKKLNYDFSCTGFYLMDISKQAVMKDAEIIITGKMGDYYNRTDHITLKKIS